MKKTLLLLTILICCANQIFARQLSPNEALQRANSTTAQQSKDSFISTASLVSKPVFTAADNEMTFFYVFAGENDKGYMIVSADDTAAPILGYADNGTFDADNMPANMKAFLEDYKTEMTWAAKNGISTYATTTRATRSAIAPLLKTTWDQGHPYNLLCPSDNGGKCYTGCVATAIAQIMNYHKWPTKGIGSNTYTPEGFSKSVTADFGATTYDWDNMLNTYTGNETDTQKNAVATLMYHCGVASFMDYSSSGSGTIAAYAMMALINNFNYDKSLVYHPRVCFKMDEWEELIYNNLANIGPVYYDGVNDEGGHAFVCDGYKDGYFHINWGWSGMSDGYFRLSALDPEVQGAGGSSSGYNIEQGALLNIQPDKGGTSIPVIVADGNFKATPRTTQKSGSNKLTFTTDGINKFANYSSFDLTNITLGVKLVSASNEVSYVGASTSTSISTLHIIPSFSILSTAFKTTGTFTATPAFQYEGKWYDIQTAINSINYLTIDVTDTRITITTPALTSGLTVIDVVFNSPFYINNNFSMDVSLKCSSEEYLGGIKVALYRTGSNTLSTATDAIPVNLTKDETQTINVISEISGTTITAGDYDLAIIDGYNNIISEKYPITLNAAPTSTSISLSKLKMTDGNTTAVNQSDFSITAAIDCKTGYFNDDIYLAIFPATGGSNVDLYNTPAFIEGGKSSDVEFKCDMTYTGTAGKSYMALIYVVKNNQLTSITANNQILAFTLGKESGIEAVTVDATEVKMYPNPADGIVNFDAQSDIKAIEIFSLSGAKALSMTDIAGNTTSVDVSILQAGNYIVTITTNDGIAVKRLIKR